MSFGPNCPICGQFACDCDRQVDVMLSVALLVAVVAVSLIVAAVS